MSSTGSARSLSRSEAKQLTRHRLLSRALDLLDREGEAALTPSAVSRAAGVAQSTFYVHFRDRDDLLAELADWVISSRNRAVREARRAARESPRSFEPIRESFRIPLQSMVAHPRLFRVTARASNEHTELGRLLREGMQQDRAALVEDLIRHGYRCSTDEERRTVEIVADAFFGVSVFLAAGVIEGRYSIDEGLDVILRLVTGLKPLITAAGDGATA